MSTDQACRLPRAAREEFARALARVVHELHPEYDRIEVLLVDLEAAPSARHTEREA